MPEFGVAQLIERDGVHWANLDPVIGSEINKTRPVVIVSDDLMNQHLSTVVACPVTSSLHPRWRSRIQFDCAGTPSEIAVDQIRTLSKLRILAPITRLPEEVGQRLRQTITEMYGNGGR